MILVVWPHVEWQVEEREGGVSGEKVVAGDFEYRGE